MGYIVLLLYKYISLRIFYFFLSLSSLSPVLHLFRTYLTLLWMNVRTDITDSPVMGRKLETFILCVCIWVQTHVNGVRIVVWSQRSVTITSLWWNIEVSNNVVIDLWRGLNEICKNDVKCFLLKEKNNGNGQHIQPQQQSQSSGRLQTLKEQTMSGSMKHKCGGV